MNTVVNLINLFNTLWKLDLIGRKSKVVNHFTKGIPLLAGLVWIFRVKKR